MTKFFLPLLVKFVGVSISSVFSSDMSCFFFFFTFGVDEDLSGVMVSAVILIGVVLFAVCTVLIVSCGIDLAGDFLLFWFPFLQVTGVHTSSLFGWFPVSGFGFLFFSFVASTAVVVFVVVIVALVVAVLTVFVVPVAVFLRAGACKVT